VRGEILDDRGQTVAWFGSWDDGRGTFELTPQPGRTYHAHLQAPAHLDTADFTLPAAADRGCVLHHFDDLKGIQQAVRVSVTCTESREVMVLASQQEQLIDRAVFDVQAGRPTTVWLRSGDDALAHAQGVARVTVFDMDLQPLAERLVYRNRSRSLFVDVTADREHYAPRDPVVLTVSTRDSTGEPVPAELSLSVVDDALLALADEHDAGLASHVLLQADLPEPIEKVDDLFASDNPDGALGIDLALGTRGWRRFDWMPVRGAHARQVAARRGRYVQTRDLEEELIPMQAGVSMADNLLGKDQEVPMARAVGRPAHHARPPMARAKAAAPADEPRTQAAVVREFAPPPPGVIEDLPSRSDFRNTVLWKPTVRTGPDGTARVQFTLSDAVTGFRAVAEGVGDGLVGQGQTLVSSTLPLHLDAKLPVALSTGDQVLLPVTLDNERDHTMAVDLRAQVSSLLALGDVSGHVDLAPGERRTVHVPLTAKAGQGKADLALVADGGPDQDSVLQHIPVQPRGFPQQWASSGTLEGPVQYTVEVPDALDGSLDGKLTLFPSTVSEMLTGMQTMVRTPGGCFEQTSSTNFPNVVVLDLLDHAPGGGGRLAVDRQRVLDTGYRILTGYQVTSGGFETWGSGPGKEALTAYGLLEFSRMSRVYDVDPKIVKENVAYLYHQRNGKGGYDITGASAHGYGTAPPEVLDAYITWALVETGHTDIHDEIAKSAGLAKSSHDPYRLALATLTMLKVDPAQGKAAAARLARLQADDGSFPGSETSITRSENYNLLVEATALSTMALLRAGDAAGARAGVQWLYSNQTGGGVWGATQGNALALEAIGEYARANAAQKGPARVAVTIDGRPVTSTLVHAGAHDPVVLDLGEWMQTGKHAIGLTLHGKPIQYSLEVDWSSELPRSAASRRVDVQTTLADAVVGMGHTTRMTATLSNRTDEVVPDPIARIGLPAGLVPQTWQLKQLQDRGVIAHFETRPREVTLYWDGIKPDETHEIALDLVAEVPGTFTAPASSAYPYYDDQAKAWVAGTKVQITP